MRLRAGTSGYAFKEWKGSFYPGDLKDDAMLGYYASKFSTVEINNTFYRLPRENVLQDWKSQVPAPFTFSIKASQRITHFSRLKPESATALGFLLRNTSTLGGQLGPILFQLPPTLKKDVDLLRVFLGELPFHQRFTIEFRHESWFGDDVYNALSERDIAMCIIDQADFASPVVATASWGYARLHRLEYDDAALSKWAKQISAQQWSEAYVYFKHDEGIGSGPPAVESFNRAFSSVVSPGTHQEQWVKGL